MIDCSQEETIDLRCIGKAISHHIGETRDVHCLPDLPMVVTCQNLTHVSHNGPILKNFQP